MLTFSESPVLFIGSKPQVNAVFAYENGKRSEFQSMDPETNLLIWSFDCEIIIGDEVLTQRVKIVSLHEPDLKPRTEYRVKGKTIVKPYVNQGNGRVAYSVTITGELVADTK